MKAVIAVHSQSGHTALLAKQTAGVLNAAGHETDLQLLRPKAFAKPRMKNVELKDVPDVAPYDLVIVGGPVWAFSASPVTMSFLSSIPNLKGKKALALATYSLPFKGFNANRAISAIEAQLDLLGADVLPGEALHWMIPPSEDKQRSFARRIADKL
jgi:flavodoxin